MLLHFAVAVVLVAAAVTLVIVASVLAASIWSISNFFLIGSLLMSSTGPVLTTTPVSNTNLYSNSTILYTSQNNLYFSNPGLQNSHSSLNVSSSSVTNTFMPSHPFVVRSSVSAPVATPIESSHMFPSYSHSFHRRSSTGSWTFRAPTCSLTVQDWLKNLRLHKYSEMFKGKTFNEVRNTLHLSPVTTRKRLSHCGDRGGGGKISRLKPPYRCNK